jgi:hypothetical protein
MRARGENREFICFSHKTDPALKLLQKVGARQVGVCKAEDCVQKSLAAARRGTGWPGKQAQYDVDAWCTKCSPNTYNVKQGRKVFYAGASASAKC